MAGFWETIEIPKGEVRHWQIGHLDLRVQRLEGEWRVWHKVGKPEGKDAASQFAVKTEVPTEPSSKRFTYEGSDDTIVLEPRFPDRPIVSYPGVPIEVPAGKTATFVCGIPLSICLKAGSGSTAIELVTLPLRHLSKTWFGTPLEGEPCYSAATSARRDHEELPPNKHRAICPVTVKNKSKGSLPIDRICIHVEHLQLFEEDSYLWTNEVSVNKESQHETSRVKYGSGAPKRHPGAKLKLSPRVAPPQNSIILKTFNHLRTVLGD